MQINPETNVCLYNKHVTIRLSTRIYVLSPVNKLIECVPYAPRCLAMDYLAHMYM